jgi:hypothetical protein
MGERCDVWATEVLQFGGEREGKGRDAWWYTMT